MIEPIWVVIALLSGGTLGAVLTAAAYHYLLGEHRLAAKKALDAADYANDLSLRLTEERKGLDAELRELRRAACE